MRSDLIIIICNGDPTALYHSERKGWLVQPPGIDEGKLEDLVNRGAKYVGGEKSYMQSEEGKQRFEYLIQNYEKVIDGQDFFLFRLNPLAFKQD